MLGQPDRAFGTSLHNPEGNVIMDNDANKDNAKAALDLMRNLVDNRYIPDPTSDAAAHYDEGMGAMMFHSASGKKYYEQFGEDYNLVTFPLIGNNPKSGRCHSLPSIF